MTASNRTRAACIDHSRAGVGYQAKCSDCRAEDRIEQRNRQQVDANRSQRAKDAWDKRS